MQQTGSNGREVVGHWAHHPRSVSQARAELRRALAGWGLVTVEGTAQIVLSELLTNAIRHTRVSPGQEIETRYLREGDGVRIEVHDASDERPELRDPSADVAHGRGLVLVEELADRWGVTPCPVVGKSVWAVLTASGPDVGQGMKGGRRHGEANAEMDGT
ncbi:ATP-binding protein [Streptomyces sp. NPDC056697]|uniref:ATP-binding protein n=1 Tax=Streptomyces sp. NPDC056697 TaxID=3345915 RepID=UPI0036D1A7F2